MTSSASRGSQPVAPFEEVFYIARHLDELSKLTRVFASPLETLAGLHDKAAFLELCSVAGIPTPPTTIARDADELRAAIEGYDGFLARAAFSRGGVKILTDRGAMAGMLTVEECHPRPENPWLVQAFIDGTDLCSFSVAHGGRVTAHSTYEHPSTIDGAGGISFVSVDAPDALEFASRLIESTRFTGQLSLDWMRTDEGLVAIECNPRATSGVTLLSSQAFVDAVVDEPAGAPRVAEAGVRTHYAIGLIRELVVNHTDIVANLRELFSGARDVYGAKGDLAPLLYVLISYGRVAAYRAWFESARHSRSKLLDAYFHDLLWDGQPIQ